MSCSEKENCALACTLLECGFHYDELEMGKDGESLGSQVLIVLIVLVGFLKEMC